MSIAFSKRELKETVERMHARARDLSELLNVALEPVVDALAHQDLAYQARTAGEAQLLPEEARLEKLRKEFKSMLLFDPERKRLFEAVTIIFEWGPSHLTAAAWKEVQAGLSKIQSVLLKNDWHNEALAPLLELPQQFFIALYAFAKGFIDKGQDDKALHLLFFLIVLAPSSPEFWIAYGMLNQHARHFNTALNAYTSALELRQRDTRILLHLADCYADMLQRDEVESFIAEAKRCLLDTEQDEWQQTIFAIRAKIDGNVRRQ